MKKIFFVRYGPNRQRVIRKSWLRDPRIYYILFTIRINFLSLHGKFYLLIWSFNLKDRSWNLSYPGTVIFGLPMIDSEQTKENTLIIGLLVT